MTVHSYIVTKNTSKTKLEVSIEHIPCMECLCCGYGCHLEWTMPHQGHYMKTPCTEHGIRTEVECVHMEISVHIDNHNIVIGIRSWSVCEVNSNVVGILCKGYKVAW